MSSNNQLVNFIKVEGAGNDFVLIDNRDHTYDLDWQAFAKAACDRRFGIGGDGIIVLEANPATDFTMKFFNPDGSTGSMCGNGGRCAANYVMQQISKEAVEFDVLDYRYRAHGSNGAISVRMKDPSDIRIDQTLEVGTDTLKYHFIDSGAPHVILLTKDLPVSYLKRMTTDGIDWLGRSIRRNDRFQPVGTNVNFVELIGGSFIKIRTFEKGVEGETLACGTGAVASAVMASLIAMVPAPVRVATKSGEILTVSFSKHGQEITEVELSGSAKTVFKGFYSFSGSKD
jgi:diaminopimelate epimerase